MAARLATSTVSAFSFLNVGVAGAGWAANDRVEAGRRERRVLARVSRAAWRPRAADRERDWALASARAQGVSIRVLAGAVGLSAARVHQLLADAALDELDDALGQLREVGSWPAPEDPDAGEDVELAGRELVADRLDDEVDWLRQVAGWLVQLDAGGHPPALNLRPSEDWPERAVVAVHLARAAAVIDRIAADIGELARARRIQDLAVAAVRPEHRAERRRRLAEPDLDFATFCRTKRMSIADRPQLERGWDAWQAERFRRGEIDQHPDYADNPYRPL